MDNDSTTTQDTQSAFVPPVGDAARGVPAEASSEDTEHRVRRWIAENLSHGRIARDPELWGEIQNAIPALLTILSA